MGWFIMFLSWMFQNFNDFLVIFSNYLYDFDCLKPIIEFVGYYSFMMWRTLKMATYQIFDDSASTIGWFVKTLMDDIDMETFVMIFVIVMIVYMTLFIYRILTSDMTWRVMWQIVCRLGPLMLVKAMLTEKAFFEQIMHPMMPRKSVYLFRIRMNYKKESGLNLPGSMMHISHGDVRFQKIPYILRLYKKGKRIAWICLPRSSFSVKGLSSMSYGGLVDADFDGCIMLSVYALEQMAWDSKGCERINTGQSIFQALPYNCNGLLGGLLTYRDPKHVGQCKGFNSNAEYYGIKPRLNRKRGCYSHGSTDKAGSEEIPDQFDPEFPVKDENHKNDIHQDYYEKIFQSAFEEDDVDGEKSETD